MKRKDKATGRKTTDYLDDVISEDTLKAVVGNIYRVFRLLHGNVSDYLEKYSREKLIDLLEDYIPAYLETVSHTLYEYNFTNSIFYELDGFQYGPVERNTYVSISSFLGVLQEQLNLKSAGSISGGAGNASSANPGQNNNMGGNSSSSTAGVNAGVKDFPDSIVKSMAVFYNAHLIYSGMSLDDMKVLYGYLVNMYNGQVSNTKLNRAPYGRIPTAAGHQSGSSTFARSHLVNSSENGNNSTAQKNANPAGYLFGCDKHKMFVPQVFLSDGSEGQLVSLCYKGILLIVIFESGVNVDARLLDQLKRLATGTGPDTLEENLVALQPVIAKQFSLVMDNDDEYKFLYFNHSNEALRVSNHYTSEAALYGDGSTKSRLSNLFSGFSSFGRNASNDGCAGQNGTVADEKVFESSSGKELLLSTNLHSCIGKHSSTGYREVCIKEADRGWICAKRSLEREFYLILDQPQMTLARCQVECARFSEIHFSNIYMM